MESPKIMVLANDTTYTYNLRREILERLVLKKYEVIVASKVLEWKDELEKIGCRIINIDSGRHGKNPAADIRLLFRYIRMFRAEKPDLVLSYNIKPNIYGGMACTICKIKYIPNITGLGTAVEFPGAMQWLTTKLYKAGVSHAGCIFFQNKENIAFFVKRRMIGKASLAKLLPGSGVSLTTHQKFPYPDQEETIHFLFVARVMKEKGIDLYLYAAKEICQKQKNVMFHICGLCDDEKYLAILNEAQKEGYITYHGGQKDMRPYFEQAHCIVHPSNYPEGMSNVLLEAAAHARPIITTNRSGCREVVEDGRNGYVIPVEDKRALVRAIKQFLTLSWDEKRKMGEAGRKKVEKEFDREIVVREYMEEIQRLLGR